MATVCEHLSVEKLEERYLGCRNATASRHFQAIFLLALAHAISQVSATTAYGWRWIEQLLARYNAEGPGVRAICAACGGTSAPPGPADCAHRPIGALGLLHRDDRSVSGRAQC